MAPSGLPWFPIDEAYLVGGWLESFVWGLYTLLFAMTLFGIYKKRRDGINSFTTVSIIILYLLATTHISLALTRLIQGFILYRDTTGPIPYFANISVRLNVAKDYIYITNLAMGDAVVAWRLYVVWGKKLSIVAFPVLMIIGELVCGYGSISQWFLPHPVAETIAHWGQGIFVISLAANIVITGAIASRIWYALRMTSLTQKHLGVDGGHYNRVILLIVESGALIAAAKIVEFTLFKLAPVDGLHGLNALYIVYEVMPQITGLAPTAIVYAVNNGFTQNDEYYTSGVKSTLVFGTRTNAGTETLSATGTDPTSHMDSSSVVLSGKVSESGRAVLETSEKTVHFTYEEPSSQIPESLV
ncbi:hypothetical protein C8Q74DRAFT_1190563 [Fomes fomentarius]|nr:hypothetical protein C8Q74DRAFT_1190563 [Fomes fomentarius]